MKSPKPNNVVAVLFVLLLLPSCRSKENGTFRLPGQKQTEALQLNIPIDKGYSEYIESYTSGIIPANSPVEIRFTPAFAARADKSASGLFEFNPSIKGKTEWKDETTLVFTPSHLLDPGKTYTGTVNLGRLGEVKERLRMFPLRIQTLKKDFRVIAGILECSTPDGDNYVLHGEVVTSDIIEPSEAEAYIGARLGRKKLNI
jgi:hypothetical protein